MTDSPRKKKKEKKEKKSARGEKKGEREKGEREKGEEELLLDLSFDSSKTTKSFIDLKDCPVQNVTVYNDRAEVTRHVEASVQAGTNEVSIFGLSSKVDRNSVRVSGGKGSAVILEVSHNVRFEAKNKDDGTEQGRLTKELEELDEKISRHSEIQGRVDKENTWLENWAHTLSAPRKSEDGKDLTTLFSAGMMEQATNFLEFYQKKLADIDERRSSIAKALKELREQRGRTQMALNAITSGNTEQVHEVVVLLNSRAENKVELSLSYIVMDARWYASYDVRVQSTSDDLDLTYYGFITNNSQDHWNDAVLALSTAQPSVGGAPPDLTTKFVGFRPAGHAVDYSHKWATVSNVDVRQQDIFSVQKERSESSRFVNEMVEEADHLQVMTSAVQESSICTSFTIPRKTTILSDNKPHKVTIRMIKLTASYTYVVIPKLSLHAYLKASIQNTSENYPFLPGEINVFMDGNFVAKSNIKAVSPQESFSLFLGTDDAIRVTYPPGVFFKDTQGLLRKNNLRTTKHQITVKNTKSTDIKVVVYDQLPKSNDSQIKVKLLKPSIPEGGTGDVSLTDANNLKWKKEIAAGKSVQIPFEYSLEWPTGQELTM